MSWYLTISVSLSIEPTWASIIFTGFFPGFCILWIAPNGINICSSGFLLMIFLFKVIRGLPFVTNQCSALWWCFWRLNIPLGFTDNSLIKNSFPSNKFK